MMTLSRRPLSLRPVLLADAAITGATALLMLAGASPLADLLDLPTALLAGAGAVLVPYVGYLLWLATRDAAPRAGIGVTIAANIAWALGCAVLLISDLVDPNALGVAFILLNAVVVLVFADLVVMAMRGGQPKRQRNAFSLEV
jgi:hypothetical protein